MIQGQISRYYGRQIALLLVCVAALLVGDWPAASAEANPTRLPSRQVSPDVVGGSAADPGSLPWLAQITVTEGQYTESCTGTVISSDLVLTAGHCVANETTGAFNDPSQYTVTTGTEDLADPARQVSGVTQLFLDGYVPSTDDRDVGILELATPTTAPAIQLATSSASLYAGDEVVIAGWGLTDPSDQSIPDQLQYASTVVQSPGFCATHGGSNFAFDAATELCTLDPPYYDDSICFGDSGGPVIANDLQGEPGTPTEIGVIDSTINNCSTTSPDYYARIDSFLPWADQLIASLTPPATTDATQTSTKSRTQLGTFPVADGKADARTVLQGVFRQRFHHGTQISLKCARDSKIRISCDASWLYGPNEYYGAVTTYLERDKGKVVWTDRYIIRSVNYHCYWHTDHRTSCPVARRAGTF